MNEVYIFKGIRNSRAIILHASAKVREKVDSIQGTEIYENRRGTVRMWFTTRAEVMDRVYQFCRDNKCRIVHEYEMKGAG